MPPGFVTARRVVLFTVAAIILYIFWIGPDRFAWESFGTWIFSPLIYLRMVPDPLKHWLANAMLHAPIIGHAFCVIPIAMLVAAFVLGIHAFMRDSLRSAYVSFSLTALVFSVYHIIQPMGVTVVYY
ncbi:MAG: hypothetical protein BGO12_13500 [Verrucomicrobia bacterium 61-8]|nr:hypothetical protein [Verrucomicrobiota bacterium]OJV00678.1 MAG: hypothetical protein BGO12_13500 [Verrucomicrobia bacterium 61-8]